MATPQATPSGSEATLQVRRIFNASRERIFTAWTQREQLEKWMGRTSPKSISEYLELDLRPGGCYRIRNTSPAGDVYLVRGEYLEIRPSEKLSFTWEWEKSSVAGEAVERLGETLVTVEFFERGHQTEVVLTHTGFLAAETRDRHQLGWNGCFDTLASIL